MSRSFKTSFFDVWEAGAEKTPPQFLLLHLASFSYFYLLYYLDLFRLLYCLKSRSWAQFSRLENFSGLILLDAELRHKSMSILLTASKWCRRKELIEDLSSEMRECIFCASCKN